jgi:prephenate dehydrogenase
MTDPQPSDRTERSASAHSAPLSFDKAAVIGAGLIGGSIGMALRQHGLARRVVAVARSDETLRLAVVRGAADQATSALSEAVAGADLVVLAAPVSLIIEHLGLLADAADPDALVTDVGSVKAPVVAAAETTLPHPQRFVGGHPLAGSERKGISAARADLLEQATWVLTPTAVTAEDALVKTQHLVTRLGAKPLLLSPQEHDELLARTSHLPHLVAAALVNVVADCAKGREETIEVIGRGFLDTTRVAGGNASLWADIALANADELLAALREMNAGLENLTAALTARNREELERLLRQAQSARDEL